MGFILQWSETTPEEPGWFWWRADQDSREEVVEVFLVRHNTHAIPNYNWVRDTLLAKSMHSEPVPVDSMGGWWQPQLLAPSAVAKIEQENARVRVGAGKKKP